MTAGRRYPLRFASLGALAGALTAVALMPRPQRWKVEIGDVLVI